MAASLSYKIILLSLWLYWIAAKACLCTNLQVITSYW